MQQSYTPEQWHAFVTDLFDLIMADFEVVSPEFLSQSYPKLVIMHEFFRLVRGEAFSGSRPRGLGDLQAELYAMEDILVQKLAVLREGLHPNDEKTKYHLDLMKKSFDV